MTNLEKRYEQAKAATARALRKKLDEIREKRERVEQKERVDEYCIIKEMGSKLPT